MSAKVTVLMYHFVRDLRHSRYPAIKGLSTADFKGQIQYLEKHYNFVTVKDVRACLQDAPAELPPRAALLTFDDGYADHFTTVFPILDSRGIQGCFFPPARALLEHEVLEVNKIHFILAVVQDTSELVEHILSRVEAHRAEFGLKEGAEYLRSSKMDHRFDTPEVVFVKRMLQRELPPPLRTSIVSALFSKYVTGDEAAFAHELYLSIDQLRCMLHHGMCMGSHGYSHCWLNTLDATAQEREIDLSLRFLQAVGCDTGDWVMCYPYGGYNESLLSVVRRKGCGLGFSTEVAIANLRTDNPLTLPRLDTNDLPKRPDAEPSPWTTKAGRPSLS